MEGAHGDVKGGQAPTSAAGLSAAAGQAAGRAARAREDRLEVIISRILQLGVLVSAAILVVGVALWALRGDSGYPPPGYPTRLADVARGLAELRPAAVVQAGLLVLLATPVIRVATSVVVFWTQGDRLFTVLTLTVLTLLVLGFALGSAGG